MWINSANSQVGACRNDSRREWAERKQNGKTIPNEENVPDYLWASRVERTHETLGKKLLAKRTPKQNQSHCQVSFPNPIDGRMLWWKWTKRPSMRSCYSLQFLFWANVYFYVFQTLIFLFKVSRNFFSEISEFFSSLLAF